MLYLGKTPAFDAWNSICCPATTYHKSLLGEPLVRSEYSYALDWDNLVQLAERPGRLSAVKTSYVLSGSRRSGEQKGPGRNGV